MAQPPRPGFAAPSAPLQRCSALDEDAGFCTALSPYPYCRDHHLERLRMHAEYKDVEDELEQLAGREGSLDLATATAQLEMARKAVQLRTNVTRRFFSISSDSRPHIKSALLLEERIKFLETRVESVRHANDRSDQPIPSDVEMGASDIQEPEQGQSVYRSLLSHDFRLSDLDHLPEDHAVKVLKKIYTKIGKTQKAKLYEAAPLLNDGSPASETEGQEPVGKAELEQSQIKRIMRLVFKRLVLWRADSETLDLAQRLPTIDSFLATLPSEVLWYKRFFESNFEQTDTLHFLRDAICDFLHSQTSHSTLILGDYLITDDAQRRMSIEGWDLLRRFFPSLVGWWNFGCFCYGSEDLTLITRLVALGRYGKKPKHNDGWLDREEGILHDNMSCALMGFVAQSKGVIDPTLSRRPEKEDGKFTEKQTRNYATGIMSKNDPLAKKLMDELLRCVGYLIVIVYDCGSNDLRDTMPIGQNDDDHMPWLFRMRADPTLEGMEKQAWRVVTSMKDCLDDLNFKQSIQYRNMTTDFYQFILVDRHANQEFRLFKLIACALESVREDDPSPSSYHCAVAAVIPESEQQQYLDAISQGETHPEPLPDYTKIQYEGSRVRAWDLNREENLAVRMNGPRPLSHSQRLLYTKMLDSMKQNGLIAPLTRFERPRFVLQFHRSADGLDDLFFIHNMNDAEQQALWEELRKPGTRAGDSTGGLSDFARDFQRTNPHAVFAKVSIGVHYCAWPMPARRTCIFAVPGGYMYEWKVTPFDMPFAQSFWQEYLDAQINGVTTFARFVQTTGVICAESPDDVEEKKRELGGRLAKLELTASLPPSSQWTHDLDDLDLDSLWTGSRPIVPRRLVSGRSR